jgi:hypothetical protein
MARARSRARRWHPSACAQSPLTRCSVPRSLSAQPRRPGRRGRGRCPVPAPGPGPALRRAVNVVADADITAEDAVGWGWLAQTAASTLWDNDAWRALLVRHVRLARAASALGQLPVMLDSLGTATAASGDFAAAEALIAGAGTIRQVTGVRATLLTAMLLASLRGCHGEAAPLIQAAIAAAEAGRHGLAIAYAYWGPLSSTTASGVTSRR